MPAVTGFSMRKYGTINSIPTTLMVNARDRVVIQFTPSSSAQLDTCLSFAWRCHRGSGSRPDRLRHGPDACHVDCALYRPYDHVDTGRMELLRPVRQRRRVVADREPEVY